MLTAGSASLTRVRTVMRRVSVTGVPSGPGWVRLTSTSGPALSLSPWARAMASSSEIGPSAWKTRGILTAPDTLMGRL